MLGEVLDVFVHRGGIRLGYRRGRGARRLRRNHQVLVVVIGPNIEYVESLLFEEQRERFGAEIGTVFVVNIPECQVFQDSGHVGDLEEDDGVVTVTNGAPHGAHEVGGIGDVLEGHFAADKVALHVGILLPVEVGDKLDLGVAGGRIALANEGGIETDAAVVPHFAQEREEFSFAAADLDHFLAVEIVLLDHLGGQFAMEGLKGTGKTLRLLVLRGVVVHRRVEDGVGNKAAVGAMAESDVALGKVHRNFARRHQQYAVHRHPRNLVENAHVALEAIWAGLDLRHFLVPVQKNFFTGFRFKACPSALTP